MKVITNITLRIGKGKERTYAEPGTEVDLNQADADALIALGHARPVTATAKAAVAPPTLEDIAEAIETLDPQKDFKDGLPILKSLERVLNTTVTITQRDEAWAKVEADRKVAAK